MTRTDTGEKPGLRRRALGNTPRFARCHDSNAGPPDPRAKGSPPSPCTWVTRGLLHRSLLRALFRQRGRPPSRAEPAREGPFPSGGGGLVALRPRSPDSVHVPPFNTRLLTPLGPAEDGRKLPSAQGPLQEPEHHSRGPWGPPAFTAGWAAGWASGHQPSLPAWVCPPCPLQEPPDASRRALLNSTEPRWPWERFPGDAFKYPK